MKSWKRSYLSQNYFRNENSMFTSPQKGLDQLGPSSGGSSEVWQLKKHFLSYAQKNKVYLLKAVQHSTGAGAQSSAPQRRCPPGPVWSTTHWMFTETCCAHHTVSHICRALHSSQYLPVIKSILTNLNYKQKFPR